MDVKLAISLRWGLYLKCDINQRIRQNDRLLIG